MTDVITAMHGDCSSNNICLDGDLFCHRMLSRERS